MSRTSALVSTLLQSRALGHFRASRLPAQRDTPGALRVLLSMPTWVLHRSTDRAYVYERFARLAEHYPLRFLAADSLPYLLRCNGAYVYRRAAGLAGLHIPGLSVTPPLRVPSGVDAIFAYGRFPTIRSHEPVLWEHTFAPQLDSDLAAWRRAFRERASRAAAQAARVVTATDVSAQWFAELFPAERHKVEVVPYYLPQLQAIAQTELDEKACSTDRVRLLFVGKEARRKGLELFVAAWTRLPTAVREQLDVTVVSAMLDGAVKLPEAWRHLPYVPDVAQVMRAAHVLVFPTRVEAYGLVLVEALAAGCLALTTSAPIQRAIVGDEAGCFVDPRDPTEMVGALTRLVSDRDRLTRGMYAARERFMRLYHHTKVGRRYADLLWETAGRARPDPAGSDTTGPSSADVRTGPSDRTAVATSDD